MEDLKRQGVIRHLGLSSHMPSVVEKVLDMKILDMLMFSINPAYDYRHGEYAIGSGDERHALYRPGVLTVLPGVRNREDLKEILGYLDASEEAKDYSAISSFTPPESAGKCVYCNHCQPCPAGLDIGLINKYYDLSMAGDALAKDHYANLAVKASDCLFCGHCDRRCPFHVEQQARMAKIAEYFGV